MSLFNTVKFITSHPLCKDNKIKSLIKFFKWQIACRLIKGDFVFEWINGAKIIIRRGEAGLTGNIYCGLHEFQDMAFLLHFIEKDDLFIDVGANVGSYTILACAAKGAFGYAFEPVQSTYSRLESNILLNYLENKVKYLNIGIGATKTKLYFTSDYDTTNHVIQDEENIQNSVQVNILPLDKILINEKPSLMKIDVEGYETLVLQGAKKILERKTLKAVIMELNGSGGRYGFDEKIILKLMLEYGFRTYSYNPFKRTLSDLKSKNIQLGNTLFVRDEKYVLDKIKNAPYIIVNGKQL
jgi:FkbM family methyltransferase